MLVSEESWAYCARRSSTFFCAVLISAFRSCCCRDWLYDEPSYAEGRCPALVLLLGEPTPSSLRLVADNCASTSPRDVANPALDSPACDPGRESGCETAGLLAGSGGG